MKCGLTQNVNYEYILILLTFYTTTSFDKTDLELITRIEKN